MKVGLRDLVEDLELERGVDIRQEDIRARSETLWNRRPEVLKDVQVRVDGFSGVEIEAVFTLPAKRVTGHLLEPRQIDPPTAEDRQLLRAKVFANNRDDPDIREERRGQAEVGCRPTHDP